jgi:hypothetical protein
MLQKARALNAKGVGRVEHHRGGQNAAHRDIFFFYDLEKAGGILGEHTIQGYSVQLVSLPGRKIMAQIATG